MENQEKQVNTPLDPDQMFEELVKQIKATGHPMNLERIR